MTCTRSIKTLLLLPMLAWLVPGLVRADTETLWRFIDSALYEETLSRISLPSQLADLHAVHLDGATLARLERGDVVVVEPGSGRTLHYLLEQGQTWLNGDRGWRGAYMEGGRVFSISLTLGREMLLATLHTPFGKYELQARPEGDDYLGWLYSLSPDIQYAPIDDGAFFSDPMTVGEDRHWRQALGKNPGTGGEDQMAQTNEDVVIQQAASPLLAKIGSSITIEVDVSNRGEDTVRDLPLVIRISPADVELATPVTGCANEPTPVRDEAADEFQIACSVASIAPNATVTIEYDLRPGPGVYPFFTNQIALEDRLEQADFTVIIVLRDVLLDSDGDGISDFNENIVNTDPADSSSAPDPAFTPQIDLLFLYTPQFTEDINHPFPETAINHLVQVTNGYYADSRALVSFRPVYYGAVDVNTEGRLDETFFSLDETSGAVLDFLPSLRENVGADMVVLMDGAPGEDPTCGIATGAGFGFEGDLRHLVFADFDLNLAVHLPAPPEGPEGRIHCPDQVLAHELGHNLGLAHSRADRIRGTFEWSYGHGVEGSFNTIMSRIFRGDNLPVFSDPANTTGCNGMPCGVARDAPGSADAVHTINTTRFQVAAIREPRLLEIATRNGAASDLIAFGAATVSGNNDRRVSRFLPTDAMDVRATLAIPRAHQGETGQAYVVAEVSGFGWYFLDVEGNWQVWDRRRVETLGSAIGSHALEATEELVAFDGLVPADNGVTEAEVTVYFGYSVQGTDVFAFSAEGISFSIGGP